MKPTCDADCTRLGWKEYFADFDGNTYHLSVAPDADLDGMLTVFDHDEQRTRTVYGWFVSWDEVTAHV